MKTRLQLFEGKKGNCYEAAGRYIMNSKDDGLMLVHGEVEGQGEIDGVRFGHAWLEKGDKVIDVSNGKQLEIPKFVYYQLGNIDKINNLKKYNHTDSLKNMVRYKHWGPWDLKTSTGK